MPAAIHLYRHMRTAWREVVEPWLRPNGGARGLVRSYVVVPTRGQAHALKQRCLTLGIPLLGVELLTPGLARSRWMSHMPPGRFGPALGREFLLFGLREIVARRLAPLDPANGDEKTKWGLLKSLQSDCERALGDFDDLLNGGFSANDFPDPVLREVFGELAAWVENLGCDFAPRQTFDFVRGGETPLRIPGRLLVHGFSAEQRGEFFNVAAFARCFESVTVTLPEPEFRGRRALDESWIELWENTLGANAVPLDDPAPPPSCENVAEVWASTDGIDTAAAHSLEAQSSVVVGATRADEMELVAEKIAALLSQGAKNIGVIFPVSDAAHLRLAELLETRGIAFVDQLETAAPPPVEIRTQRALLAFYKNDCRIEDALALWPLLHAQGQTGGQPFAAARDVCERLFDRHQSHSLARCAQSLADGAQERADWADVAEVFIGKLLGENNAFAWPEQLTIADALARFSAACERFDLGGIPGDGALREFAKKETRALPAAVVFSLIESFLPERAAAAGAPGRGCFARVTLTTRRRAEGGIWSHLVYVEANAGIWPARQEPSGWLPDEARAELNKRGRGTGLFTADDRAFLEKRSHAALARDTSRRIVFSAALFEEEEPELKLAPNGWLERVRWQILAAKSGGSPGHAELFDRLAQRIKNNATTDAPPGNWHEVWRKRRDPAHPFDEYSFCAAPRPLADVRLGVRQIEDGVADPISLWFAAVLKIGEVGWRPFERSPKKMRGQLAHWLLSRALPGEPAGGGFCRMLDADASRARLAAGLEQLRAAWPDDSYWTSFHIELAGVCRALLEKIHAQDGGGFVATEYWLPKDMRVRLDPDDAGSEIRVSGRMDLLRLDRPHLEDAIVDIIDFKTGGDTKISAKAMGEKGWSLQLGIYLEAARLLGATNGRVWLVKPDTGESSSMDMSELPEALACLRRIKLHLDSGRYGALTEDANEHGFGGEVWPLACVRIPHTVLQEKSKLTFGGDE